MNKQYVMSNIEIVIYLETGYHECDAVEMLEPKELSDIQQIAAYFYVPHIGLEKEQLIEKLVTKTVTVNNRKRGRGVV
jgi:hypothetical protein